MTYITINYTRFKIDWNKDFEDVCSDCYEHDRREFIGDIDNLKVYRLYGHDECFLIECYLEGTESYTEGIAGIACERDYYEEGSE